MYRDANLDGEIEWLMAVMRLDKHQGGKSNVAHQSSIVDTLGLKEVLWGSRYDMTAQTLVTTPIPLYLNRHHWYPKHIAR